jgi:hypothetical protein
LAARRRRLPRNNLGWHHWIEAADWSFDLSNGNRRFAIVMRSSACRIMRGLTSPASIIDAPRGPSLFPANSKNVCAE